MRIGGIVCQAVQETRFLRLPLESICHRKPTWRVGICSLPPVPSAVVVLGLTSSHFSPAWDRLNWRSLGAPVDVNLTPLVPGELHTTAWRGRSLWFQKRAPEMLSAIDQDSSSLVGPLSRQSSQSNNSTNQFRAIKPGLAVMIRICTHLGCIPTSAPRRTIYWLGSQLTGRILLPLPRFAL